LPALVPLDKRSGGFVDVEELADYTRLCVKTIRREIEDRNLPHHKVRGRLIISVSDALAWLSARREV
jgi:excisionase family DNA binding protein